MRRGSNFGNQANVGRTLHRQPTPLALLVVILSVHTAPHCRLRRCVPWRWGGRHTVLVIGLLTGAVTGNAAFAQPDEIAALNVIAELRRAGKYSEAIPLAEKFLQLTRAQK